MQCFLAACKTSEKQYDIISNKNFYILKEDEKLSLAGIKIEEELENKALNFEFDQITESGTFKFEITNSTGDFYLNSRLIAVKTNQVTEELKSKSLPYL